MQDLPRQPRPRLGDTVEGMAAMLAGRLDQEARNRLTEGSRAFLVGPGPMLQTAFARQFKASNGNLFSNAWEKRQLSPRGPMCLDLITQTDTPRNR